MNLETAVTILTTWFEMLPIGNISVGSYMLPIGNRLYCSDIAYGVLTKAHSVRSCIFLNTLLVLYLHNGWCKVYVNGIGLALKNTICSHLCNTKEYNFLCSTIHCSYNIFYCTHIV